MQPVAREPRTSQPSPPLALDEDGFLVASSSWTRETALLLSRMEGIDELTPQHWALITYIRDYHGRFGAVPLMRRVCRSQNLRPDSVKQLFGSCLSAWKIAGLPNPGEEAKAYMT